MKRMRVVAQISQIESALYGLNTVLDTIKSYDENTLRGTVTDANAPYKDVDMQVNFSFVADDDDSFINILFRHIGVGTIYGVQSDYVNSVDFVLDLDLGKKGEIVGNTEVPPEAVASAIYAVMKSSGLPDKYANEILKDTLALRYPS